MYPEYPQNNVAPSKKSSSVGTIVLGVVTLLLLVTLGTVLYMWMSTRSQLTDVQAKLNTSQSQLAAKDKALQAANAQLIPYRDSIRKANVASFVNVVRAYNAKNHTHLTTEGSTSKQIYDTQLSKSIPNFIDPKTGVIYDFVGVAAVQSPPPLKVGTIQYQWAGKCGATTLVDTTDDTLSAVATLLEDGSMYCLQV